MQARVPSNAALASAWLLCLAVLAASGCNARPSTPEELFAQVAAYNESGQTVRIWELLTEDRRSREVKAIDAYRSWLRKNPSPEELTRQFNSTREEFMTLPYAELYRRENLGRERALVEARIIDRSPDPRRPGDEVLTIQPPAGPRVYMRVRKAGGGWELDDVMVESK